MLLEGFCSSLFPASRGLSRRYKLKREERDLCRLPTSCLMKPPTEFLVETYRFLKPVSFNVQCACLVRLYADHYGAHGRLWLPRDLRVSKFLSYKIVCFYAWRYTYKEITSLQRKVILGFLEGRDTFSCLPTGYGKSVIFASS